MQINTIQGDDNIHGALNNAMTVTVGALIQNGALSQEDADRFLDTHVCLMMEKSRFRSWWDRHFGDEGNDVRTTIVKVLGAKVGDIDE